MGRRDAPHAPPLGAPRLLGRRALISFRPLGEDDLPQLHRWLQREHVKRWWNDTHTLEETTARYGPALRCEEPTDHYVIAVDGREVGMIETYLVADHPEWDAIVEAGDGVAGVDLLIGEPDLVGRGLGPRACVATVDEDNGRSWRAFEKAGFRHVRDVAEEGRTHRLMRLDRVS